MPDASCIRLICQMSRSSPNHSTHQMIQVQPLLPLIVQRPVIPPIVVTLEFIATRYASCCIQACRYGSLVGAMGLGLSINVVCIPDMHPSKRHCRFQHVLLSQRHGSFPCVIYEYERHLQLFLQAQGVCRRTLVRMRTSSPCLDPGILSCTLMILCTMGMSRPLILKTTTSPALKGFLPMYRNRMSPL